MRYAMILCFIISWGILLGCSPIFSPHIDPQKTISNSAQPPSLIQSIEIGLIIQNPTYDEEIKKLASCLNATLSPKITLTQCYEIVAGTEPWMRIPSCPATLLLHIQLHFPEVQDAAMSDTYWIHAQADCILQDALSSTIFWQQSLSTSQGIIHWPGRDIARQKAVELLCPLIANEIQSCIPQSDLPQRIRVLFFLDDPEELRLLQMECQRLEKKGHFKILGPILTNAHAMSILLQSQHSMLTWKNLWESVCQSLGILAQIRSGPQWLIVESR